MAKKTLKPAKPVPLIPVVTAQEMARLEQLAIADGCAQEKFMMEAGRKVAAAALERKPKRVALLVGKGNNGGDAYAAGICLLDEGVRVRALTLYPMEDCSALNRKFGEQFRKKRGVVERLSDARWEEELILDGFLGTGFRGSVEPAMARAIERANGSGRPILAIDIPSGLDGTTGEVRGAAIVAQETVALGFPKSGFFLREGWNRVGKIRVEDFGLPKKFQDKAVAFACVPDGRLLATLLPLIERKRHKYQAGYVVGFSGSSLFRGAPKLAGLAALRSGAGIVRIFHREDIGEAPLELICQPWNEKGWREEVKRAGAVFIGPGIGQSREVARLWKKMTLPIVIDADALQTGVDYPKRAILTPHRGEVLRLLNIKQDTLEEDLLARCQKYADRKDVILLLKGAPTFIFAKDRTPVIIPYGDPGMASAGTGDVLTGILAALLAQRMDRFEAAILGATLHALAGEEAAQKMTSYGLIAGDLVDCLPQAFRRLGSGC